MTTDMEGVRNYWWAIEFWTDQTPEICMAAVQQEHWALGYVKDQTPEICMAAVRQNGCALKYVKDQTPEICLAAVQQDGWALFTVKNQTPEICIAAINQTNEAYFCVTPTIQNHLATLMITDICIAMKPLRLPSYVLLDIIDQVLDYCTLTHWQKIHQVIRINEKKRN